jgi:hypothetical protein
MLEDNPDYFSRPDAFSSAERHMKGKCIWDEDEPTWPGEDSDGDDDEAIANGMSDDDSDDVSAFHALAFGSSQRSLWDEALARIFASRTRSAGLRRPTAPFTDEANSDQSRT